MPFEYVAQFGSGLIDEVRSHRPPFDFTYLVGTKNGESDFKLDQIREMMAQNICLELIPDFAPHKRSIRDNIKGSWAQVDPVGRGYPKNFMSFGFSTIEIPIAQIRATLSNRLAKDLIGWWLNEAVLLPAQMLEMVRGNILKRLRLTEAELIADLSAAADRSYTAVLSEWVNSIRNEIANDNLLQCTQQGVNVVGTEKGKILRFVDGYLKPKVDTYRADHFRELSPDERLHGDYLQRIYINRDRIIQQGRKALEQELYRILEDRTQGPKFAGAFIIAVRQIFEEIAEKFRHDQNNIWSPNETSYQHQYEAALQEINESKDRFGITKQVTIEECCDSALIGLEGSLSATIERKVRAAGLDVIARLKEHLPLLERRFNRLTQKLIQTRDFFKKQSDQQADRADTLAINGIKLYDRQELNGLYQDLIEQLAGASEGSKTPYEIGMDAICSTISEDVLQQASPFWKETRAVDEVMRLFDLTKVPDILDEDVREIIFERAKETIEQAPQESRIRKELTACDRIFKVFNDDEILANIRITCNKSKSLLLLSRSTLSGKDAGFTPALNTKVAIFGGRNTVDPAAQKLLPSLRAFYGDGDILPLGDRERHRIIFVQELGGFSLRTISGMRALRQTYQDWKGEYIVAKWAKQRGKVRGLAIMPVHITKELPFWDIFPEDPVIFALLVQAKAFQVLCREERKTIQEKAIFYIRETAVGLEKVDIASSWEEAIQVLEISYFRSDREEIQQQVTQKLTDAETDAQKQILFQQLIAYLEQRALELEKLGGRDSPDYKREARILLDVVETYQLKRDDSVATAATPEPEEKMLASASSRTASGDKVLGHLERLAQLKQSGILTDDEFQTAKKRLLDL